MDSAIHPAVDNLDCFDLGAFTFVRDRDRFVSWMYRDGVPAMLAIDRCRVLFGIWNERLSVVDGPVNPEWPAEALWLWWREAVIQLVFGSLPVSTWKRGGGPTYS